MHEQLEPPQNNFTPALAHLLGQERQQRGQPRGFDGIYAARLLYEYSCNPNSDRLEGLLGMLEKMENIETFDAVLHAIEEIADASKKG